MTPKVISTILDARLGITIKIWIQSETTKLQSLKEKVIKWPLISCLIQILETRLPSYSIQQGRNIHKIVTPIRSSRNFIEWLHLRKRKVNLQANGSSNWKMTSHRGTWSILVQLLQIILVKRHPSSPALYSKTVSSLRLIAGLITSNQWIAPLITLVKLLSKGSMTRKSDRIQK